jgi:hypothetical protein
MTIEAAGSSGQSVHFYQTVRRHISIFIFIAMQTSDLLLQQNFRFKFMTASKMNISLRFFRNGGEFYVITLYKTLTFTDAAATSPTVSG